MKNNTNSVFIVGPTASGKSELAMQLAKQFNGEIICADSQTVRRDLDIGTAKPTMSERKAVTHHMLDVIGPYDSYSVSEFKVSAELAIKGIEKRGKLPIIVGGSGLYIDALLYNFKFRKTTSKHSRSQLELLSVPKLQAIINDERLPMPKNRQNPRHLIRVIETGGQPSRKGQKRSNSLVVGLDPGKEALEQRIKKRVKKMLVMGLLDEVDRVVKNHGAPPNNFDAIGYKIVLQFKKNHEKQQLEEIEHELFISERRYARRQRTWFKRNKDIVWFEHPDAAYQYVNKLL